MCRVGGGGGGGPYVVIDEGNAQSQMLRDLHNRRNVVFNEQEDRRGCIQQQGDRIQMAVAAKLLCLAGCHIR